MTWDVPTAEDCPECGQTLFKKSGRGRMKPFCINEKCSRFLPEDQRGYYKKKTDTQASDDSQAVGEKPKKAAAGKTAAAKKTGAKTAAAKKPAAKKTTAKTAKTGTNTKKRTNT